LFFSFFVKVGTYNPIANSAGMKEIRLKTDRLKYWLSVGAQPSDRVGWILGKFGVLPSPPPKFSPLRSIPKDERPKKVETKTKASTGAKKAKK
jgi:ribosomal protein S16